ncbi:G-protein coupled receptors family 1 profile domain-containing protein [Caenorhabditis elegans]|uniref:G-protein coupled receptors family 1 profile domain-containing protein n=1 Tax=Caenorhabditis elegans TaxID=6239 RepID=Q9XXT1_CAEEL|nr:G-protein coupled receptors family 1 profile domain-containing protein [Caenorhabditis elegans]CAA16268.5 G-protein coupled receptors family 1 profile domain-containing protein [Caenorhabditis elegans]|eukprot:NP_001343561.1 Serpentine Receptor, class W [Caenorhabditis elegans]
MNSSKATDYVVPEEFRGDAWLKFSSWINSISAYLYLTDFIISFIGIFPSLFHFWILTRTYMRHLTTNLFLIGITVCGIIHIICNIIEFFPMLYDYYLSFKVPSECFPFAPYSKIVSNYYSSMTNAVVTGMLTYFTVAMAIIRFLVVKFPLASGMQRLIYSKSGLKILLPIIILILPLWIAEISSTNIVETGIWVPGPNCDGFAENYTEKMYTVETSITFGIDEFYWIVYYIYAVIFQFIPSILLPISTVLLIIELKKNKKTTTWTK